MRVSSTDLQSPGGFLAVEVIFPSNSIEGDIGRYLLGLSVEVPKALLANPIPECRRLLTREVQFAFAELAGLFDGERLPRRVRVEVSDDLGQIRPETLGALDVHRTQLDGIPVFSISGHLVLDLLLEENRLGDYTDVVTQRGLWRHELVHLADWARVEEEHRLRETDVAQHLQAHAGRLDFPADMLDENMPREWLFLGGMSHYRAEGLAELMVVLTGQGECECRSRREAVDLFRQAWDPLNHLLLMPRNTRLIAEEWGNVQDLVKLHHTLSYCVGPWMVLDVLAGDKDDPGLAPLLKKAGRAMAGNARPLAIEDAVAVVRHGMSHDLGSFLRRLGSSGENKSTPAFLENDELGHVGHFLSYEDAGDDEYPNFMATVAGCARAGSAALFIATLKEVLGCAMPDDEINAEWAAFEQAIFKGAPVPEDYLATARRVMEQWRQKPDSEILRWTMTYLLDPVDVIRDSLPYLGYMDDHFVAQAGLRLASLQQPSNRSPA